MIRATVSSLMIAALFYASSCGRPKQKVEVKDLGTKGAGTGSTQASGIVTDPNCSSASACKSVEFTLQDDQGRELAQASGLSGKLGVDISWSVQVAAKGTPAGRIKIALINAPVWMESAPGKTPGSLSIVGTPRDVMQDSINIRARDMTRCAINNKKDEDCTDVEKFYSDYDKDISVKFSISQ